MPLRRVVILALALTLLLPTGCNNPNNEQPWRPKGKKDYSRPLGPGEVALRKIGPEEYPDFSRGFANRGYLEEAIQNSLSYLNKPSSRRYFPYLDITHERAVATLQEFLRVLREASSGEQLDALIRERFEVYKSKGWDGSGTVFFTGYYCPIFDGRRTQEGPFRYPIYSLPADLLKDEDGNALGQKMPDGSTRPYPPRAEIERSGMLRGREIAWLKDPFEAYVATVQGSTKLRLADGSLYELGYAGNNGHEYKSIASKMIEDGAISRDELSLQALIHYFAEHPDKVDYYTSQNPRYVFFQERRGGPYGSLNVPVLPYRSIATDKQVYPRACLAFLDTALPRGDGGHAQVAPYAGFTLDQDTGGAIRAAGRCDVFFGIGPAAEGLAGRTGAEGELYYIAVKPNGGAAPPGAPSGAPAPRGDGSPRSQPDARSSE